jgi:ketosteroid isomerase-like protein
MSNRQEIERVIKAAYAARKIGDVEAITQLFAPDAQFQMAGSDAASPIAMQTQKLADFRTALRELIHVFEWIDQTILSIVVEGQKAVVHWRGTIRSNVTGETVETELVDLFEIRNGRIASLTEFCDTALVTRMMQR